MKKIFASIAMMIVICNAALAQKKASFGFTAGASLANFHAKVDGESDDGNSRVGFTAGVFADVPMANNFAFQPAMNFVQKGTTDEQTSGGVTEKAKLNVNCIEIPLNFVYTSNSSNGKFFIGAGPSITFHISGKASYDDGTNSISASLHFGNGEDDALRGMDFGANILAGVVFKKGFLIAVNFNQGFSNLLPGGNSDGKLTSHYFGLRLGYLLKN
jgi:hypothetical protein